MLVPSHSSNIDLLAELAVRSVPSPASQDGYRRRLREFLGWYAAQGSPALSRATVREYRQSLVDRGLAPATINQGLSAIKAMVREAVDSGILDPLAGASITQVPGVAKRGSSCGRWLTEEQARQMLQSPDTSTLIGRRDYALLALLFGCGLRRSEAVGAEVRHLQQRDGQWCLVDLVRKRGKIGTPPVPDWTYRAVKDWLDAARIEEGPILRGFSLNSGAVTDRLTGSQVQRIVQHYSEICGCRIGPHDARRSAATILMDNGATVEQLRQFLGHDSVKTTEFYLSRPRQLRDAACNLVDLGRK